MNRVTRIHLERLCDLINRELGTPDEPYTGTMGNVTANAGCVYVSHGLNGYRLEQISEGGGSRDLLQAGYEPARVVHACGTAFLQGVKAGKALS